LFACVTGCSGACLLLAIKISDDFFVSSRIFQAAVAASHDDAKRICQISNRHVPHDPGPGYEIVCVSACCATSRLQLTTARQDPRIVPPFSKRALNDAIRSIERVMKVPCAAPVQATAHHRDPRSAKATLLPWSGLPSWRWIWSCPSANNRRAALPCACRFVYFLIARDVMLRCFIADLAAHQEDPRGELCFVPPR